MTALNNKPVVVSRAATIVIFLALIRCISEVFRLNYYAADPPTFFVFRPFLIGALTAAIALLAMTILSFYGRYKAITVIAVCTVIVLLIEKYVYGIA